MPEHPRKFSPQSAPHQTKEKRTAPLALSPRRLCFPMSLYPSPPALCSTLSADAPTTVGNFFLSWKQSGSRCAIRRENSPAGAQLYARRVGRVRGEKVCEWPLPALCYGVPFVYTCDRWMGLLVAAPSSFRSPKSPALSKSNNCAYRAAYTRDHHPKHACPHV